MNSFLIKSLTIIGFLNALVNADQAPKIKLNPKNVFAIAEFPAGFDDKVMGNIIFSAKNGKMVQVHVDMTGLPSSGGPFQYHIHDNPVPENGDCNKVGLHFNPYNAPSDCNEQKDDSYCQVGDLSGKHGWIDTTCFETKYDDPFLSLNKKSKSYIVGKSITFHYANLTKFACANIALVSKERLKQLKLEFENQDLTTTKVGNNLEDYSNYFNENLFINYSFNEDESINEEIFELAQENNEEGYDYNEKTNSPRQLINIEFNNKNQSINSTQLNKPKNWTNSSNGQLQNYDSSSCENNAGILNSQNDWLTAGLGVIIGLLI